MNGIEAPYNTSDTLPAAAQNPIYRAGGHARSGRRSYSPGLGRWLNRDPIGEEGGVNIYGFVYNNPQGQIDLFGLMWAVLKPEIKGDFVLKSENQKTSFVLKPDETIYGKLKEFKEKNGKIVYFSYKGHGLDGDLYPGNGTATALIRSQLNSALPEGPPNIKIIEDSFADDAVLEIKACQSASGLGWTARMQEILPKAAIWGYSGPVKIIPYLRIVWARRYGFPTGDCGCITRSEWISLTVEY